MALILSQTTYVQPAFAHFLQHKKHLTLEEKVRYFARSIHHDQTALTWLFKAKKLYNRTHHHPKGVRKITLSGDGATLDRMIRWHRNALRWYNQLYRTYSQKWYNSFTPIQAISFVFGIYADQAIRVSHCETGGTFSVYAQNGQYRGLFQMGSRERAKYGDSYTAYGQSVAAHRYFIDSGSDWSPWTCKPW